MEIRMLRVRSLAALFAVALLVLAPTFADARAGGSYRSSGSSSFSSQGSLGSRTYSGTPLQRSMTPQPMAPGAGAYSYGTAHPFWTGLAGGLFGGWLGSMLFPHWGMGYGYGGIGGGFGSIFIWLLLFWLGWRAFRLFASGGRTYSAGLGAGPMMYGAPGMLGAGYGNTAPATAPLALNGADYGAFETILKHVQADWSKGDLSEMRHYATPEMLSYFSEQLAENESQGVRNTVDQVELLQGTPREAWDEGRLHYATCYLRWRAVDYTVRADRPPNAPDAVVSGDPTRPVEAAELWTFVRSPGGLWLLSAIQQV
jgi:predicted lipid-binding transport protein (Tim44 family)